jgi:hypothetical protein
MDDSFRISEAVCELAVELYLLPRRSLIRADKEVTVQFRIPDEHNAGVTLILGS